ncbi:MAG: hypothetical protein LBG80_05705 [Bacteroidales bacterium]|jgi:hypothetical protein|nr:hypothetical protein [Bacteroidales bacterium]
MSDNIHNKSIPKEVIEQALMKVDEAMEILDSFLYSLTPDTRQTMLKMGDKSLAFVEKTKELAAANPKFCPSYLNIDDLNIDLTNAVNLRVLNNRLQQFSRKIDDTAMLAGSEAYAQALSFYNSVKQATRDNISGAQPLFDELKKRFVLGRPKKGTNQTS